METISSMVQEVQVSQHGKAAVEWRENHLFRFQNNKTFGDVNKIHTHEALRQLYVRKIKDTGISPEQTNGSITVTKVSKETSDTHALFESLAKENLLLGEDVDFFDLEEISSQTDSEMDKRDTSKDLPFS